MKTRSFIDAVSDGVITCLVLNLSDWRTISGGVNCHLDPNEKNRVRKFTRESARNRFLAGRWLIRHVLSQFSDDSIVPLRIDQHGKPYCPLTKTPKFNLSHSGDWVVAVFSKHLDVGVDVELTDRRVDMLSIADRFFSPKEQQEVLLHGREAFFQIWIRKEAWLKASGVGLSVNLCEWDVFQAQESGNMRFDINDIQPNVRFATAYSDLEASSKAWRLDSDGRLTVIK